MAWFLLALVMFAAGFANAREAKVNVLIDLSSKSVLIEKINKRGKRFVINGEIIPVAPGTIQPGVYRPKKMVGRFRTLNGNTYVENLIYFADNRALRTTRMFSTWRQSGRPSNASVVMEAEVGSILYDTIRDKEYGLRNTRIEIRR